LIALNVYDRIYDEYKARDGDEQPIPVSETGNVLWLDYPGCAVKRSDLRLPKDVQTEGLARPGLYLSIVLKGNGEGGPLEQNDPVAYHDNEMIAMALRTPTRCGGTSIQGAHMRAVGVAFPQMSLEKLGLDQEFQDLFTAGQSIVMINTKAPARIQAIAIEMMSAPLEGRAGQLLLGAHATEILIRSLFMLQHRVSLHELSDDQLDRMQSIGALIKRDLGRRWTIAELAAAAGVGRRTFNSSFRSVYGVTAKDYITNQRLDAARDAMIHRGMSVAEAAFSVGYEHPANFATAFRRRFGHAPSKRRENSA